MIQRFLLWLFRPVLERIDALEQHIAHIDLTLQNPIDAGMPHLSMSVLQAWEAVVYAANKFDRDEASQDGLNRSHEVMLWARLFLTENRWPDPGEDQLKDLLAIRDSLKAKQLT